MKLMFSEFMMQLVIQYCIW